VRTSSSHTHALCGASSHHQHPHGRDRCGRLPLLDRQNVPRGFSSRRRGKTFSLVHQDRRRPPGPQALHYTSPCNTHFRHGGLTARAAGYRHRLPLHTPRAHARRTAALPANNKCVASAAHPRPPGRTPGFRNPFFGNVGRAGSSPGRALLPQACWVWAPGRLLLPRAGLWTVGRRHTGPVHVDAHNAYKCAVWERQGQLVTHHRCLPSVSLNLSGTCSTHALLPPAPARTAHHTLPFSHPPRPPHTLPAF